MSEVLELAGFEEWLIGKGLTVEQKRGEYELLRVSENGTFMSLYQTKRGKFEWDIRLLELWREFQSQ